MLSEETIFYRKYAKTLFGQGLAKQVIMYQMQQGSEEINSNGGISLIGALSRNVKSSMKFEKMTFSKVKSHQQNLI